MKQVFSHAKQSVKSLQWLAVALFFFTGFHSEAQVSFFKIFSNEGYDYGEGVTEWKDSSYYVCGTSSSFNDAPSDAFLLKLSKTGDFEWSRNYGGSESDLGRRVLNWRDSIFFIAGYSNSGNNGDFNFALWKVDTLGNLIAAKQINYSGWERLNDALIVQDSALYLVGETNATDNGFTNGYIVKTDLNGDSLWTVNLGGTGDDVLNALVAKNDTSFYALGATYVADSNATKGWIVHFDHHGTILWSNYYGLDHHYALNDAYLQFGNIYAVGTHTYRPLGDQDEFLLVTDLAGTMLNETAVHSDGDVFYDQVVEYGSGGKVYIASHYKNQYSVAYSTDVGITRFYDNLVWDMAYVNVGFIDEEFNNDLLATKDGGAIAVGYTTLSGLGGSGVYVLKIGPNDDFPVVDQTNVTGLLDVIEFSLEEVQASMFPNPANETVTIQLNEVAHCIIRSTQGQEVYAGSMEATAQVTVSDWKAGMYFVTLILQDGRQATMKLLVQ